MLNVFDILEDAARKWPNKVAIYDSRGQVNFAELLATSKELAQQLQENGVSRGCGIGVQAKNSREFIYGLFAGIATGATVMPLSHQLKEGEITEIIAESGLHFILTEESITPADNDSRITVSASGATFMLRRTEKSIDHQIASHVHNPAFIRFTSGTTGKAKGVVVSHESIYERVAGANRALQLDENDVVIWVLPIAYHFIASIVLYVYRGAAIALADNFMAPTVLDYIEKYNGTLLYASPMHLRMLASDRSGRQMPGMQKVISTSTSISTDICEAFYKRYHKPVSQAYGIIEIGLPLINNVNPIRFPDSVGRPVEGYQAAILNDMGEELPAGQLGILAIKGPGMFDAYLNPPVMREQMLTNGYFLTADYAEKDTDGLIFVKGRKNSVINVSGNKVFPEEVEHFLNQLPEVKRSRIYGVEHPIMGQIVQAEIVPKRGAKINTEDLISYCRKNLSSFKIPQRVKLVEDIPLTDSGKIKRH